MIAAAHKSPSFDPADLPRIEDLPIPSDVSADDGWPPLLLDIATHIGAHAALSLCDRFGGVEIAISANTVRRFASVLDAEQSRVFAHAFEREHLAIPVAARPILHAKRAGVLAAVRAGGLSIAAAAFILRTPRRHLAHIIRTTSEGVGITPTALPPRRDRAMLDMAVRAVEASLSEAGVPAVLIADSKARLLASASGLPAWSDAR